jgi:DNA-3-methyladenine glycosylase
VGSDIPDRWCRPSPELAPELLGWLLTHVSDTGTVTVALTEVEAYDGAADPASHAFRGPTRRSAVMFGPAGRLYVYFSYGMHWCANVVCGPEGQASAVLLRSGRVIEGVDVARRRRGERVPDRALARGPACLTQAIGIDGGCNGADLLDGGRLVLEPSGVGAQVASGPRVGVSAAADVPWRFWIRGDDTVSTYRRSPRAAPSTAQTSRSEWQR